MPANLPVFRLYRFNPEQPHQGKCLFRADLHPPKFVQMLGKLDAVNHASVKIKPLQRRFKKIRPAEINPFQFHFFQFCFRAKRLPETAAVNRAAFPGRTGKVGIVKTALTQPAFLKAAFAKTAAVAFAAGDLRFFPLAAGKNAVGKIAVDKLTLIKSGMLKIRALKSAFNKLHPFKFNL